MGNPLRDRRTPSELASSGQVIDFKEKINEFDRLIGIVEDDLGALDPAKMPDGWRNRLVTGRLEFGFVDAQGALAGLQGEVAATIDAVCQRCLEPLQLAIAIDLRLLFGGDESALADDSGYENWELEEDRLRPLDLVEEALIMAMPFTAMHVNDETCNEVEAEDKGPGERTRPFAALKAQMENEN